MGGRFFGDLIGGNLRSFDGSLGVDSCLWLSIYYKGLFFDIEVCVVYYWYCLFYDKYVKLFFLVDFKVIEFNNDGLQLENYNRKEILFN